jgi:hypothetical protein
MFAVASQTGIKAGKMARRTTQKRKIKDLRSVFGGEPFRHSSSSIDELHELPHLDQKERQRTHTAPGRAEVPNILRIRFRLARRSASGRSAKAMALR